MGYKDTYPFKKRLEIIKYFLSLHPRLFVITFIISLLYAVTSSVTVAAVFPFLSLLFNKENIQSQSSILSFLLKLVNNMPLENSIVAASIFILFVMFLKCILELFMEYFRGFSAATISYDIRKKTLEYYANKDYQFFLEHKQGELVYNIYTASYRVCTMAALVPQFTAEFFSIVCFLILLFTINFPLTILIVFIFSLFYLFTEFLGRKIAYPIGKRMKESLISQQIIASEFIRGFKQISIFLAKKKWIDDFEKVNLEFKQLFTKDLVWLALPKNILEFFISVFIVTAVIILNQRIHGRIIEYIVPAGIYLAALQKILPSVSSLCRAGMQIMGAMPDLEICYSNMTSVVDTSKNGACNLDKFSNSIKLDDVTFSYNASGKEILLKNINLEFKKGKITAIVGISGSGKTTIINLILGLMHPQKGAIMIDGVDLRKIKLASWLEKIGFVSQDSFIFHSTINDNITFGNARYFEGDVRKSAEIAGIGEFIRNLPDGYNTIVGERGMKISGGQQQRVAIARAAVKNPEIIILDEATSALDNFSEKSFQDSLWSILKNRTVIIIAHRLSTILNADKIIVLKNGEILAEGDHQHLIKNCPYYSQLYSLENIKA